MKEALSDIVHGPWRQDGDDWVCEFDDGRMSFSYRIVPGDLASVQILNRMVQGTTDRDVPPYGVDVGRFRRRSSSCKSYEGALRDLIETYRDDIEENAGGSIHVERWHDRLGTHTDEPLARSVNQLGKNDRDQVIEGIIGAEVV